MQPARELSEDDKQSPGGDIPPLTPWAKTRFDLQKPGYGKRAAPGGNDPILQCDPMGFPRILYFPTPFEFAQLPNRMLQMFERDHVVREIWTDGRALPADPDPLWYGYSVGKWVDDTTFVVQSTGYDDRTWLGAAGFPHSEFMRVEERYQRVDRDTINFTLKIDGPQAYTKPWVALPRVLKLRPRARNPPGLLRGVRRERLHQANSRTWRPEHRATVISYQRAAIAVSGTRIGSKDANDFWNGGPQTTEVSEASCPVHLESHPFRTNREHCSSSPRGFRPGTGSTSRRSKTGP